ncbi:MAG: glycosyltransferase [Parcubacteria group bacterium]|nr:glycosyltransferase [Parcubacteria group bacterium]
MDGRVQKGLVSVIIPTYNVALFLKEAVDSALQQTYRPFEIIIVDDGSKDGTSEIVTLYGDRVRYFEKKHEGVSLARNFGVTQACGEFIAFLDADDVWDKHKLERQVSLFSDESIGLVYTDMEFFGETFRYKLFSEMACGMWAGHVVPQLLRSNFIGTSSVIVKRILFEGVGGFPHGVAIGEDYRTWLKIALKSKIEPIRESLVRYRIHGNQASKDRKKSYKALIDIYATLLKDRDFIKYRFIIFLKYMEYKVKLFVLEFLKR